MCQHRIPLTIRTITTWCVSFFFVKSKKNNERRSRDLQAWFSQATQQHDKTTLDIGGITAELRVYPLSGVAALLSDGNMPDLPDDGEITDEMAQQIQSKVDAFLKTGLIALPEKYGIPSPCEYTNPLFHLQASRAWI